MDAVRPPDRQRVFVLARFGGEHVLKPDEALAQDRVGAHEAQRERRVDDVGRRQAVVDPLALVPERLGHGARERDDVVARLSLDRVDAVDVERRVRFDEVDVGVRDMARGGRPGAAGGDLDVQPGLVLRSLGPDRAHGGARVAVDHRRRGGVHPQGTRRRRAMPWTAGQERRSASGRSRWGGRWRRSGRGWRQRRWRRRAARGGASPPNRTTTRPGPDAMRTVNASGGAPGVA